MAEITFESLGIQSPLIQGLSENGITLPTPVQCQVIPAIQKGGDLAFQSETGTGKTFAYLLPLVQQIEDEAQKGGNERKEVRLVIAAPTHELASQIKTQVQMISAVKAALLIGGAPLKRQIEILKEKPAVIIGSASRLLELYHLKKLKLDGVHALVLDEVDRLLAPELRDDTAALIGLLKKAQLVANSATITKKTASILAEKHGREIETLFLPPEDVLRKRITHIAIFAEQRDKIATLRKLLSAEKPAKALIFTSRVDQVANITVKLKYHNVDCASLHAKTDKQERKATIDRFRSGKCPVLITSDLASRGLDIPGITHVIQMDLPSNDDFFVHRAGRTARAGKTGTNIVLGDAYEMRKYAALEKRLGITVYPKIIYKGRLEAPESIERE